MDKSRVNLSARVFHVLQEWRSHTANRSLKIQTRHHYQLSHYIVKSQYLPPDNPINLIHSDKSTPNTPILLLCQKNGHTLIFSQYKRKIKRNRGGQSGAGYVFGLSSANFGGNGGIGWINPSYASVTHKNKIWTASTSIGGILSAGIYQKNFRSRIYFSPNPVLVTSSLYLIQRNNRSLPASCRLKTAF